MQVNNYVRLLWATRGKTRANVKQDKSCANIYYGSESHENEEATLKEKGRKSEREKVVCERDSRNHL